MHTPRGVPAFDQPPGGFTLLLCLHIGGILDVVTGKDVGIETDHSSAFAANNEAGSKSVGTEERGDLSMPKPLLDGLATRLTSRIST